MSSIQGGAPERVSKPLSTTPEKEASKVDPQVTLGNASTEAILAPAKNRAAEGAKPVPGNAFIPQGKIADPTTLRFSTTKQVAQAVSPLKPEKKPLPMTPLDKAQSKLNQAMEKLQKAEDAQIPKSNFSINQMNELAKQAENLRSAKNEVKVAQAELNLIQLNNDLIRNQKQGSLLWIKTQEARIEKEKLIAGGMSEKMVAEADKKIKTLEKTALIKKEIMQTEISYLNEFKKLESYLNSVMKNDKDLNKKFGKNYQLIKEVLKKSEAFEEKLRSSSDVLDAYRSHEFKEYSNAIGNYTKIYEDLSKDIAKLDFVRLNKKLPKNSPNKVSEDHVMDVSNKIKGATIAPVQRLMRHPLLLNTLKDSALAEDKPSLEIPLKLVSEAAQNVNHMQSTVALTRLAQAIETYKSTKRGSVLFRLNMTLRPAKIDNPYTDVNAMLSEFASLSQSQNKEILTQAKTLFDQLDKNSSIRNELKNETLKNKYNNINALFSESLKKK